MKVFEKIGSIVFAAGAAAVKQEVASLTTGAKGQAKLDAAVADAAKILDGFIPGWAAPIVNALLPILINAFVAWANANSLFGTSAAGSTTLPAMP